MHIYIHASDLLVQQSIDFCKQKQLCTGLSGTLWQPQLMLDLTCSNPAPRLTSHVSVSRCRSLDASKILCVCLSWLSSLLCHTCPGTFCSIPSQSSMTSVFSRVCTHLQSLMKTYLGSLIYKEMTVIPSCISVVACLLMFLLSWHPGLHLARRLLHQRKEFGCIWKDTYLC